jgi:hypothetical protein
MSASVNARSVCVRTFPGAPVLNPSAVIDVSSGASTTATISYAPSVQNTSFTFAPHFFAMPLNAYLSSCESFEWQMSASPHDRQATSPLKAVLCFGNHTYPFNM